MKWTCLSLCLSSWKLAQKQSLEPKDFWICFLLFKRHFISKWRERLEIIADSYALLISRIGCHSFTIHSSADVPRDRCLLRIESFFSYESENQNIRRNNSQSNTCLKRLPSCPKTNSWRERERETQRFLPTIW
jgi:hypothetical protein